MMIEIPPKEFLENELSVISTSLQAIKSKLKCDKVRIIINDNDSGRIEFYNKQKIVFQTYKKFKSFDELIKIFSF